MNGSTRAVGGVRVLPVIERDGRTYGRAVVRTSDGEACVIVEGTRQGVQEVVGELAGSRGPTIEQFADAFWERLRIGDVPTLIRAREIVAGALLSDGQCQQLYRALVAVGTPADLWNLVQP